MNKVTANVIRSGMSKRWTAPEYAIMWEVGQGTGSRSGRYADAIMMSLWPSRGLELHGVEIKVSRSDWRREAADPSKAEAIARFCDRWWVHTAPGVVDDLSDLPPAWGLREFDGKKWSTLREAEKTEAEPITRTFLAAMLRRADETMRVMVHEAAREGQEALHREAEKRREQFAEQVQSAVARRTEALERSSANVAEFEQVFGPGAALQWGIDFASLGKAARTLHECRNTGFGKLSDRLRAAADEIDAISALVQPEGDQ